MSELVDGGHILRRCTIDIADQETALTLNAKCYDAAIFSFEELIDDLSLGPGLSENAKLGSTNLFSHDTRDLLSEVDH